MRALPTGRYEDRGESDDLPCQELFREVNEQAPAAGGSGPGMLDVICECVRGCLEHLTVPRDEYEAVRRFPTRFLVQTAHVGSGSERIVERHESYVVVEKIGAAATEAVRLDPRRRSRRAAAQPKTTTGNGDAAARRPQLLFFYSPTSGPCRRVEGYLAQVLQAHHNHDTFDVVFVDAGQLAGLAQRHGVESVPAMVVLDGDRVLRRSAGPLGSRQISELLGPWLR